MSRDRICSSTMDVVMHVARSNLMPEIASVVGINLMLALAKAFAPLSPRESAFTPPGNPALSHPLLTEQVGGTSLRMDSACHKHTRESVVARLPTSLCVSLCLSLCLSLPLCVSMPLYSLSLSLTVVSLIISRRRLSLSVPLSHTRTRSHSRVLGYDVSPLGQRADGRPARRRAAPAARHAGLHARRAAAAAGRPPRPRAHRLRAYLRCPQSRGARAAPPATQSTATRAPSPASLAVSGASDARPSRTFRFARRLFPP